MGREWRRVERDAFRVQSRLVDWRVAVAGSLATTAPLVVGALADDHRAGLYAGLGGLNVGLAASGATIRTRAVRGGVVLAGMVALGALATALHPWAVASVLATVVIAGALALTAAGDRQDALVGFVLSAVFVIVNGLPGTAAEAPARAAELAVGGIVALVLFAVAIPDADEAATRPALRVAVGEAARTRGHVVRVHAVRLAATTGLATAAYRALDVAFGYWIPLTALAVLQPDGHTSRVRALQRATGTLVGTALVVVAAAATSSTGPLIALVAVASAALFALRERSYHWLVTLLTPTALLMISTVGVDGRDLALDRVGTTAAGIALALVAAAIVPRHP